MIFFHKEHLGELRVINVAPTCNTHLHRLESLCHQPKMNFASASFGNQYKILLQGCSMPKYHTKKFFFRGICGMMPLTRKFGYTSR